MPSKSLYPCKGDLWAEQNGLISRDITVSSDPRSKLLKSKLHHWLYERCLGTGYEEITANTLSVTVVLWFFFLGRLYFLKTWVEMMRSLGFALKSQGGEGGAGGREEARWGQELICGHSWWRAAEARHLLCNRCYSCMHFKLAMKKLEKNFFKKLHFCASPDT